MGDSGQSINGDKGSKAERTSEARLTRASAVAVLMVLGAFATGLVIRNVRSRPTEAPPPAQTDEPVQEMDGQGGQTTPDLPAVVRAPVRKGSPPTGMKDRGQVPPTQPTQGQPEVDQGLDPWLQVGWTLDLTEEEQARLREGWQNLSPEEREAHTARFTSMADRWQTLSEAERQEASRRIQERVQQWRQGDGSAEELLGNLSLE